MARIRSIKPEFWKSEAIACHDFFTRLVFIGLWTYVDDNGVGVDNHRLITAELFPLEEDFAQTSRDLRDSLARLANAGRIRRYTVDGKAYLAIVNWSEHQRVDRPNKPRYPQPDDPRATQNPPPTSPNATPDTTPRDTLDEPSRGCRDIPAPGAGEQGAGEQGNREVPPSAERSTALAVVPSEPDTAQALIGEWIDHCRRRPPGQVIGQIGKQLKQMLAENIAPADIRRGLAAWHSKGLHPSALPSVVNELMNAAPAQARPSTTDQRVNAALELAARYAAEEAS